MRRISGTIILLFVLFWLLIPTSPTRADGLPDLGIVDVYYCKEWEGSLQGNYAMRHRLSFRVRNLTSVPAIPRSPYTWLHPNIFIRTAVAFLQGQNVWVTLPSIGAHQTVGPFVARGISTNFHSNPYIVYEISVDHDNPPFVEEITKQNNFYWRKVHYTAVPWCPGTAPRAFGVVFKDNNRNGRRDAGEPGIKGVIVQLWQGSRFVAATRSRGDGSWSLNAPRAGTYSITALVPRDIGLSGASFTTPRAYYGVPLTGGARGPYRFGLASMPPPPPAVKPIEPRPDAAIVIPTMTSHPIVIGQDPNRRGADVIVRILSRPVTYIWYEFDTRTNRWVEHRAAVTNFVNLNSIRLTATLRESSRRWIREALAQRYPGAFVRRPFWNLRRWRTYRVIQDNVLPDGTHEVVILVSRIPFEDPGVYTIRLTARTRGTSWPGSSAAQVQPPATTSTPPRTVQATAPLRVYLLETTIVR